jgi:hypothetical protein
MKMIAEPQERLDRGPAPAVGIEQGEQGPTSGRAGQLSACVIVPT